MSVPKPLTFKVADQDWEFDQVHQLNYKTFVEEIPQHPPSTSRRLVDKFHTENTYLICLQGRELVGMLAVRGNRPFSLDQKLPDLNSYLPPAAVICEVRLLAVEIRFRGARGGQILRGMLALLWQHAVERNYGFAIISGTTRQQKLYQHLGFAAFGPIVGSGDARFQPMSVALDTFETAAREFLRSSPVQPFHPEPANFLPGPVAIRREVRQAFEQTPESHRSETFQRKLSATKKNLCELVRAENVELFTGSGTLANDVVAGQLSLLEGSGIILSNGEFGERLVDHAQRFGLKFNTLTFAWGEPFDMGEVERWLLTKPSWLWCVHCETSTGVLADVSALKRVCANNGTKLCLDAISTIGTVPVHLGEVYLASGTSGKGLRAYPGLSMVFYNHAVLPAQTLPRCLDLGLYAEQQGVPFTLSSNLLGALHRALESESWPERFSTTTELSVRLRSNLCEAGFDLVGRDHDVSPAVISIALPRKMTSTEVGNAMERAGYLISYKSDYLRRKNWIQICLMGECASGKATSLVKRLNRVCRKQRQSVEI
ncbi:MAG TPA: aminotransferase class V-fold PLP-dependent enzyme [Verrucomicrobiae bacterium]|jgi:aspartate aminotransferase-like enzyme